MLHTIVVEGRGGSLCTVGPRLGQQDPGSRGTRQGKTRHLTSSTVLALLGHTGQANRGSQVGSHSLRIRVDGCGCRWTRNPCAATLLDSCGRRWTGCGDLRIRRLGVRVPPGVPRETPAPAGVPASEVYKDLRTLGAVSSTSTTELVSHRRETGPVLSATRPPRFHRLHRRRSPAWPLRPRRQPVDRVPTIRR